MQWSAASCVQEIQNVSKILKTRNTADVATTMVENLKIKLFKLGKLDMGECVMLYEAVKESDLISEHQAELNKVIDGKITTGGNDDVEEVNGYGQKIDDSLNCSLNRSGILLKLQKLSIIQPWWSLQTG